MTEQYCYRRKSAHPYMKWDGTEKSLKEFIGDREIIKDGVGYRIRQSVIGTVAPLSDKLMPGYFLVKVVEGGTYYYIWTPDHFDEIYERSLGL